ncbi:hypothetical protein CK203_030666 [Vitis vinifera]|uniref:Uncharacterized protein n=1 Tax=Vitis vinifera TaxID=29760 RepID=A0A438IRM2_VITVI|nr:hypothetical protein CK203_082120 [Vitis vinifera]RVW99367.1 hypothetical protein CK203_030666 [Vitis vinifera]
MSLERTQGSCVAIRTLSPSSVSRCPHASASSSGTLSLSIFVIHYPIVKFISISSAFDRSILSFSFAFNQFDSHWLCASVFRLLGLVSVERLHDLDLFTFF